MGGSFGAQLKEAERRGLEHMAHDPRADSVRYDPSTGRVELELVNGCAYAFPASLVQDLQNADSNALTKVSVDGQGFNLHWPALDVDLYVPALVAGIFGTREWMSRELARVAGRVSSPAKTAAARRNGAKGGRPPKSAARG